MHHLDLILTLTGGLATALVLGYLTHRLGLSPIVWYLVGGIVVGPHTPGFVANQASAEVIRLARELNPSIRLLARAAYVRALPVLHQAGAERVFSGEGEVALALTEAILRTLGATPDQIDRERDRVHRDLFNKPTVAARQEDMISRRPWSLAREQGVELDRGHPWEWDVEEQGSEKRQ